MDLPLPERESQYSPSRWSNRFSDKDAVIQDHVNTTTKASNEAKVTLDCELKVPYGPYPKSKLDVFGADSLPADAPIFAYIHGGYWTFLSRDESSFMAKTLADAGVITVAIGYELCPQVSLDTVIEQLKMATKAIMQMGKQRGSRGVYLGGSCAGAYLVAHLLATDWEAYCDIEDDYIKGGIMWSGIYDLRPLVGTYINEPLKLTSEHAWELSIPPLVPEIVKRSQNRSVAIPVAQYDPSEFKRQTCELSQSFTDAGLIHDMVEYEDVDHFLIIENLIHNEMIQTKDLLRWMGVTAEMRDVRTDRDKVEQVSTVPAQVNHVAED